MNIPQIIKESRKKLYKSASEAADAAGISRGHWANFESGGRVPLPDNVLAIVKTIKLSEDQAKALFNAAIDRHDSHVAKLIIHDLEEQVADSGEQIAKLQGQLREIVLLLRQRGVELPDSCADIV